MTLPRLRGLGSGKAPRKREIGSAMMMVMMIHMMCYRSMAVYVCWVVKRRLRRASVAEMQPGKKIRRKVVVRKALLSVVSVDR